MGVGQDELIEAVGILTTAVESLIDHIEAVASSRHSRHRSCAWPVQRSPVKSADGTDWDG